MDDLSAVFIYIYVCVLNDSWERVFGVREAAACSILFPDGMVRGG